MGINLPQLAPASTDRVSGASIIDGSLKFDGSKNQYLKKTFSSDGNRTDWTYSCWVKYSMLSSQLRALVGATSENGSEYHMMGIETSYQSMFYGRDTGSNQVYVYSEALLRDPSAWYHLVFSVEAGNDVLSLYINGKQVKDLGSNTWDSSYTTTAWNKGSLEHQIGAYLPGGQYFSMQLAQVHFVDGQRLGAGYFGYNDPLTGTWRPKKFKAEGTTVNDGTEWTTKMSNTSLIYAGSASNVYNGNITPWNTNNYASYNVGTLTLLTGVNIKVESSIRIYGNWLAGDYIVINGVNYLTDATGSQKWISPIGVSYPLKLTSLALDSTPENNQNSLSGVEIDGVILKDSTTQNLAPETVLVGTPSYPSDFTSTGNKTSNQTGLSFSSWTSGSYTGAVTKIFKNSTDTAFTLNVSLVGGSTDRYLWYSNDLTNWTYVGNIGSSRYYQLSGYKYYATSEGSGSTTLHATGYGHNSFYLPLDGNSPIGQDQSGRGNNWTPINFGGSNTIEKATGALPILNTVNGGNVARPGVFGSDVGYRETVSSSSGGGNPYIFGTRGTQPTLSFIRGATYIFDYSSATSHPLRFATAADAAGSTEYTDGTSVSGNVISFTVPHNAPDTLYYYCTNHSGMGNSISVTTDETKADPYAWKCTLALPCIGTSDDVSHLINCTTSELPIVDQANAHADFSTGNFYGGSYDLDDSGDYINVNSSSPYSHVNFGTGDYTAECWVYLEGTGDEYVFNMSTNHGGSAPWWGINFYSTNLIRAGRTNGSGDTIHMKTTTFATNKWMHIAVSRASGTSRLFLDGVLIDTQSDSDDIVPTGNLNIGAYSNGGNELNGFVQDARIYNGVAKYTDSFIPASTNPDILPDTPSGVATKTQLTKVTDGAVKFDGSGSTSDTDYLVIPSSSDFAFGTGDFTIEYFLYLNSTPSLVSVPFDMRPLNTNGAYPQMSVDSTLTLKYYTDTNYRITGTTGGISLKKWVHIALSRSGTSTKMFVDGIQTGNTYSDSINYLQSGFTISSNQYSTSDYSIPGFISNFRVIKGTALYTSDFTPPTRALTNVTNTKLLCCQSNTSAIAAAVAPGSITANGDVAATNFNPFTTDINTVRGQEGSYATLNPLRLSANTPTLSENNLTVRAAGGGWENCGTTIDVSSGKYYWEVYPRTVAGSGFTIGVALDGYEWSRNTNATGLPWLGSATGTSWSVYSTGQKYYGGSGTNYMDAFTTSDVIGVALDIDNHTLTYYQNGISKGVAFSNVDPLGKTLQIGLSVHGSGSNKASINFGQKPFEFAPPDGFQPLTSSTVRPETVITRPDKYFKSTTYSGNATTQHINVGLRPDFVWIKERTDTGGVAHYLGDTVRGVNKNLQSDGTSSQGTDHVYGYISSVDDKGFTVTGGSNDSFYTNGDPETYMAWTWKAGGNKNTFNVDDVGYANASDVNMNVDALSNKTQNWSGNATGGQNVGNAFDGTGPRKDHYSHSGSSLTVNFSPALSGRIIVYGGTGGGGADTYTLSDGSSIASESYYTTAPYYDALDFGVKSNITSLTCSGGYTLYAVMVDGKLLVDSSLSVQIPSIAASAASVGTEQGFSIVKYSGNGNAATIPHGLLESPDLIIHKFVTASSNWSIWTPSLTFNTRLTFTTDAESSSSSFQSVNAATFDVGSGHNDDNVDMIAYCWHNVPGLQKFGSYVGNGDSNGPFIELGFRASAIIIKNTTTAGTSWYMYNTAMNTSNPMTKVQAANTNASEITTGNLIDVLNNGFKIRSNLSFTNQSGNTFIYMAWAEQPSFNLFGASANAR